MKLRIQSSQRAWKLKAGLLAAFLSFYLLSTTEAQPTPPDHSPAAGAGGSEDPVIVFSHSPTSRFWVSGQINIIFQAHPSFAAKYSGPNSLHSKSEQATSRLLTLYTGLRLNESTEILMDLESTGGGGLSDALGLAGFTNLDVVRNPDLGSRPYLARAVFHKTFALSQETVEVDPGPLGILRQLPARRLEFRFGKFSLVDFFDLNSVGSDSHLQFMNWTIDNNGAFDYAADTRGYTYAAMVEFQSSQWGFRFAEALMPKVANGIHLDLNLSRAHSENLELEWRHKVLAGRTGTVRLLGFVNHANMGSYREAINAFLAGQQPLPDIQAHPLQVRRKYGFGVNVEETLTRNLKAFARWGWNDGRTESYAYTEVDRTLAVGAALRGETWKRKNDKIGAAFVVNGISGDHRRYLALGGQGFLLGDGNLTYGREKILESYYTMHLWRGVFGAVDLQHITNPGYNQDRGPVLVPSLRLHIDF